MLSTTCFAVKAETDLRKLIHGFDRQIHHPQDLFKSIKVEYRNTAFEKLNKKHKDFYIELTWNDTGDYNAKLVNTSGKLAAIDTKLESIAKEKIYYVVPKKLAQIVVGYELKKVEGNTRAIRAIDTTGQQIFHEIYLEFNEWGYLNLMISKKATGTVKQNFHYLKKDDKQVLARIELNTFEGKKMIQGEMQFNYEKIDSAYLVSSIDSNYTHELVSNKRNKNNLKIKEKITFKNYQLIKK
ncbi:MAG: hypothetical protein JNM93_10260 [Bacteriovoracaceae bacterium]|nr:hypothetical protein [Bacteriovoracaceae bacterium]